jgi:hypothetical protein
VPLDGLGGDPVGQGADLELVGAEEVGVVGGDEVGGQFVDLGGDGILDLAGGPLDGGPLLRGDGCRGMMDCGSGIGIFLARHAFPPVYKDSTNFQVAHRILRQRRLFD